MSKRLSESQVASLLKQMDAGVPIAELRREHGVVYS